MPSSALRSHEESPRTQVLCATTLGVLTAASFLCLIAATLGARWAPPLNHKDYDMLLKVLGFVCAGVFIGATLLEVKQLRLRRRKKDKREEQEPPAQEAEGEGETTAEAEQED